MTKYAFGWQDLLLLVALGLSLSGHFYPAMAVLAVYAVLYHRAIHARPSSRTVTLLDARHLGLIRVVWAWTERDDRRSRQPTV